MVQNDLGFKIFISFFLIVYFGVVWHYSVNIPYGDDYAGVLPVVTHLSQAKGFRDFLSYLFFPYNDGRMAVTYGIGYLQYLFSGQLNFKWLIVLGNLFRVGIFFLVYWALPRKNFVFACLLFLFIFQLKDWENVFWAMSCLPVYSVIFLAFLTLFLLHKSLNKDLTAPQSNLIFVGANLSAVLAIFAYGNGIFLIFLGLLMLVWNRVYGKALIYLLVMIIFLGFYFYDFQKGHDVLTFNLDTVLYILTFLGGVVRSHPFSPVLGILGCLWALYFIRKAQKQQALKNQLFLYYLVFIGMSAVTAAAYRVGAYGVAQALDSRYAIYSILFFAILLSWHVYDKGRIGFVLGAIMILIFIINTPQGINNQKLRMAQLGNYQQHDGVFSGLVYPNQSMANEILLAAKAAGVYYFPGWMH